MSYLPQGACLRSGNPVYLAAVMFGVGWAMLFGGPYHLIGTFLLLAVISFVAIQFDAKEDEANFGDVYRHRMKMAPRGWAGERDRRHLRILEGIGKEFLLAFDFTEQTWSSVGPGFAVVQAPYEGSQVCRIVFR